MDWKGVFLERHACTHSRAMNAEGWWKEEDTIWSGLSDDQLRTCPEGRFNSVVWLLWHMARCEDVAVNAMLRQGEEVLDRESWLPRLGVTTRHIGTGATMAEVVEFSQQVDLVALRTYRAAVGRTTREWIATVPIAGLEGTLLQEMVDIVVARGDLGENARWVADYWLERDWSKAGFLTWLAVEQHWFHIGEAWVTRSLLRHPGHEYKSRRDTMNKGIATGSVHHLTLTVSDVERARQFYTSLLGFQEVMEWGPRVLLSNGSLILALGPASNPEQAIASDRFDENRVGLDHLSLSVGSRQELDQAMRLFDDHDVPHGEIKDLGAGLGLYVLAFRDPDNIQLELTSPYS